MATATEPLSDPVAEAIAQRAASLVLAGLHSAPAAPAHTDAILTRSEARAYVKRPSEAAFCDWCKKWRIRPRSRGRYSRLALDRALELEARTGRRAA